MSTIALIVVTGYLYVKIPKGFFPEQDTGFIFGQAEARQDISFPAMAKITHQFVDIVKDDPAVSAYSRSPAPARSTRPRTPRVSSSS